MISAVLDVLFAFPGLLPAILVTVVLGPGLLAPAIALALTYTSYIARVLCGTAVREYVAACELQECFSVTICAVTCCRTSRRW